MAPPARIASLVLVTGDGGLGGAMPPFEVATPWWQDAKAVLVAARRGYPGLS